MANPLIAQGSLNKLLANVVYAEFPELNVISSFLTKEGISLSLEGDASLLIGTMTAAVPSPEPYQMCTVTMHILRTQGMGTVYKQQFETNTLMGSVSVIPDTSALEPYELISCVLKSVAPLNMNGTDAGFVVTLQGIYQINADMFLSA